MAPPRLVTVDPREIDEDLVRRLVARQFLQRADQPVTAVEPGGVDNRTFRLGDRMTVRLPAGEWYALQVAKEQEWLPRLAPRLPLPILVPLGRGVPGVDRRGRGGADRASGLAPR
jgi:aminoglycoside phosphotransferase (APT) family kinase protein